MSRAKKVGAVGCGLVLLVCAGQAWARSGVLDQAYMFASAAPARATQGYLGIDVRDVTDDQVAPLKLRDARGAEIVLVDHDAPAGQAGLREHDVVLQMNGIAIEDEDQIRKMLRESPPGKNIVLLISRDGQQITISAQMASREEVERRAWEQHLTMPEPPPDAAATTADSATTPTLSGAVAPSTPASAPRGVSSFIGAGLLMNSSYTGAILEKMSTQQASYFGAPSGEGLLVRSVVANSPAAQAGMHACDVILKANDHAVATPADWTRAVKSSHGGPLTVVVLRDKKEQTLTLTPDGKKRSSLETPAEDTDQPVVAHLGFSWIPRL